MSELEDELASQIQAAKLPQPERQYKAILDRRFRWDFAWPAHDLLLEVDGGIWSGGRHVTGIGVEADAEKQCLAAIAGFRAMRVTARQVRDGRALQWIKQALQSG